MSKKTLKTAVVIIWTVTNLRQWLIIVILRYNEKARIITKSYSVRIQTSYIYLAKLDFIEITKETGSPVLKKSHNLYFDIQGQLHICKKRICLFAVWTSNRHKMFVDRIQRDDDFFNNKMITQLQTFYNSWLVPELINPRLSRGMQIREPNQLP